jgi:hypothetical protein
MSSTLQSLRLLASRIPTMIERLATEGATRNALLMPFLQALGYDVFDPAQVWQGYSPNHDPAAEVDCAVMRDGQPALLATCCAALAPPDSPAHAAKLRAAFAASRPQAALQTNGLIYLVYLPIQGEPTRLPDAPTWTLDLTKLTDDAAPLLAALHRDTWDPAALAAASARWQRAQQTERALLGLLQSPPPALLAALLDALRAHLTPADADPSALLDLLRRLRLVEPSGMRSSPSLAAVRASSVSVSDSGDERLALLVVRGIGCGVVNPARLCLRDDRDGAALIALDDNPQRPVVRLQWSDTARAVTLYGEGKRPRTVPVLRVDDLLQYAELIVQTLRMYEADDDEVPVFRLSTLTSKLTE